jgi:hypothetical protein
MEKKPSSQICQPIFYFGYFFVTPAFLSVGTVLLTAGKSHERRPFPREQTLVSCADQLLNNKG